MTEKVKVSRELATAIETALEYCGSKNDVLQEHIDTWSDDCIPLNSLSFLELAEILVNGYEVEQTPEEKWEGIYKEASRKLGTFNYSEHEDARIEGLLEAIEEMTKDFNLKIKGVSE